MEAFCLSVEVMCFSAGHFQKYKEMEKSVRVEEIDGVKLVKNLAVKMEEVFRKKAEATRVGATYCMSFHIFQGENAKVLNY